MAVQTRAFARSIFVSLSALQSNQLARSGLFLWNVKASSKATCLNKFLDLDPVFFTAFNTLFVLLANRSLPSP
jgi:hypothetical protein